MTRLNTIFFSFFIGLIFLGACAAYDEAGDYWPVAPQLSITTEVNGIATSQGQVLNVADTLSFDVNIYAEGGFDYYHVNLKVGNGSYSTLQHNTPEILGVSSGDSQATDDWTIIIEESMRGKNLDFEFLVMDLLGESYEQILSFQVAN